jgi:2,4-dienoyl-CoA reductase-like NADH-dependent reductase (Old Yellow Enzyme family)
MTRLRASADGVPGPIVAKYYAQRAGIGLLVTEGVFPSDESRAYPGQPGIVTDAQAAGWAKVAEAVHAEGGTVFCCRFGLALHGAREEDLIAGVIPAHPLDVQDAVIHYARKGAIINSTYMV